MKRFWLVLLSLGLVMAFSASAFAGEVKFSGSMDVGGMYIDKINVIKRATGDDGPNTSFYFQRLRVQGEFIASPGVSVITRADIMERILGGARSAAGTAVNTGDGSTYRNEQENIGFDLAYIRAATPIGLISAGYIPFGTWGTIFNNSGSPKAVPGVNLAIPMGNFTALGWIFKVSDNSNSAVAAATAADVDYDLYLAGAVYRAKGIEAGVLAGYKRSAAVTKQALAYTSDGYLVVPYFKATFGPVYLEGELSTGAGKAKRFEKISDGADVDSNPLAFYLNGTVNLGPAYVGATFAYWAGDDPAWTTKTKYEALNLGSEWSPTLIMWNRERAYWFGTLAGSGTAVANGAGTTNNNGFSLSFQNAYFWQVRGGVKPTDKLDIMMSLSKSDADQNPAAGWISKDMGWEVDVTATYKITNNLSYMLGAGYLMTGDYFKGTSSANEIRNDYLVTNKLSLTF